MKKNRADASRRTVLRAFGAGTLAALGASSVAAGEGGPERVTSGTARSVAERVRPGTARSVAERKVRRVARTPKFTDWAGATVGKPVTLQAVNAGRGPRYVPVAYVFAVRDGGDDVGYVTVAARDDWAPVLEYSTASPPTRHVSAAADAARRRGGEPTGRLLYHGGAKYGLELADGRAVNVRDGRPAPVSRDFDPAAMSFDAGRVGRQWHRLTDGEHGDAGGGQASAAGGVATAAGGSADAADATWSFDSLWDVPAWTEHDDGGADYTLYGTGADTWNDWDGCVPVAASMVIAYHEGFDESDEWFREYYIDHLHQDMNTNDAGSTYPWDVDDGFDSFAQGSHDYDGRNIYVWTHPDFTKSEITDNERPFLLNMTSGDSAEDRSQSYGDHSVAVVGYANDGAELEIHDTWDDEYHYLAWGSWMAASYTKVTKS